MTTERSGMSLEAEAIALAEMLDRFAASDTEAAEGMDETYEADHWADVQSGLEMNADTNRKAAEMIRRLVSFAVRHAAVPDAKPLPDLMLASYHEAVGWNACRKAMLAQRDGGLK